MTATRVCPRCKKSLPRTSEFFTRYKFSPDGLRYQCKVCTRQANRTQRDQLLKAAGIEPKRVHRYPVKNPGGTHSVGDTCPPNGHRATSAEEFEIDVEAPAEPPVVASEPSKPPDTREALQVARLKTELERCRQLLKDTQKLALTGEGMREILGTLGVPNVTGQPDWLKGASSKRSVGGTPVLFLSDIHFDEVVSAQQIGGSNEYDREIAVASLQNTFRNAVKLLKGYMSLPKYDGIVVPLGGDLLSGNIHEELVETNEAPIQVSMLALEECLIEGLGGMADEFGKVHVPCVTGNHGRMHKKPRAKNRAFESFEWAIYQRLASYFRNDSRLTFDIPEGPDSFFSIYNLRFCLTHGDQFRGGDGIGGIMVPIMRGVSKKLGRQQAIGDAFDVCMMGHWHQYIHMNRLIINGSVKGYDEYAYSNNFSFEPPQQALFVVHPEHGCTFRMPVLCRAG